MTDHGRDTIAAISTAYGRAALAVVRISGPGASEVAAALGASALGERRAELRRLVHPETREPIDRAVVTWYPGPASYTGEDLLEISSHGGTVVPSLILDAACAAGARPAERGEFTRRAYLNGKLDLVQAEATVDLIDARSTRMGGAALFALERGLSRRVERLREAVIELQALIAYDIDFPDEDDGPIPPERVDAATTTLIEELESLLRHAPEGELLRDGALTVIAGRANAGKSSLFNALLGIERALVTEEPGTTRDAIEAVASVDGYPFRLVDTAGLRDEPERIESMGIEVARAYLERADLAIVCIEANRPMGADERGFVAALVGRLGAARVIVARTKGDLADGAAADGADGTDGAVSGKAGGPDDGPPELRLAAPHGEGVPELREAMLAAAFAGLVESDEQPLVTRRRHARALERARESVEEFRGARTAGLPPEIAATHLQDAALALEELLGVVTTDDVLDALFAGFCVGK